MADTGLHRSLAIALFLASFCVCDVSAQKKPAQQPLGTPLGTPVQTDTAVSTPVVVTPSAPVAAPATSTKQSKKSGAPLGTPLGTPMYGAMNADTLGQLASTDVASNSSFTLAQLQFDRVRDARVEMRYGIKKLF